VVVVLCAALSTIIWPLVVLAAAYMWPQAACWGQRVTCPKGVIGSIVIVALGIPIFAGGVLAFRWLIRRIDRLLPSVSSTRPDSYFLPPNGA
jgi:hypothetical protein